VYRVLERLPARDREILILFELEELSGGEIAALLGIKVENLWLRMHRARARFLKLFQASEGETGNADVTSPKSSDGRCGHAG